MKERIIYHIDCNSAFLSWESVYRLRNGSNIDLREIPSVVGGNEKDRHGIVLAKSIPAKKYKIKTGESLRVALGKCPSLVIVPPRYGMYIEYSQIMANILGEYSDKIQRFSIDECFVDITHSLHLFDDDPISLAYKIKKRIHKELGFTVNIGISSNKLLAKMASDFQKPNNVHTCFPDEIAKKMWGLDVGDLFMVGRATKNKLIQLGVMTIGDLAKSDKEIISSHLNSHGRKIWNYANGRENSEVRQENYEFIKGIGNSTTIKFDVKDKITAYKVILGLTESVAKRLRGINMAISLVAISITTKDFITNSKQKKLSYSTDSTTQIYNITKELFNELWDGTPIRKLGVRVCELTGNDFVQMTLFDDENTLKLRAVDKAVDQIRNRYGDKAVMRACFINSGFKNVIGGIGEEDYPMMPSML